MAVAVAVVAVIALAVAVGSALVIAHYSFGWPFRSEWPWGIKIARGPDEPRFLDALKVGLTMGAGVGGAVALVVAYRRQGIHERQEPRDRYGAAVSQLGSEIVTVRLAGVYALANLADEWTAQRQQCVDVLCAYLRLPWESTPDPDHPLAARTLTRESAQEPTETQTFQYPAASGEIEVRKTILRVIAEHLRPKKGAGGVVSWRRDGWRIKRVHIGAWSKLRLDFTAAELPDLDFNRCQLPADMLFNKASFTGDAFFAEASFTGSARFDSASFTGKTSFHAARFTGGASFDKASFTGKTSFHVASFTHASFREAAFDGDTSFHAARFTHASFREAAFDGDTSFHGAIFTGGVADEIRPFLTSEQLAHLSDSKTWVSHVTHPS
jgi:hypothetical protein